MRERDIFIEALQQADPAERSAYLDAACAGDDALRQRVLQLLALHEKNESFLLDAPAPLPHAPANATVDQPITETAGTIIGPYKLLEEIGEGGMGTVWMAQQAEPVKRLVALKVIKAGMDSKQVIARFEAERQALALMDHPNIAKVLDGGTTPSGRPYFVMDLVKGVPITKYCDEHHLTPRQRLELFVPVCSAVQHAHQKGIIHRDLKPFNVLVALYDGRPVPKVIDFGVAKAAGQSLTDKTLVTGFGNIVGTLEYMSPEQAEVNQLDIDTRSDIYSLGVLLYELLAGSPPFSRKELEKAGMLEMLRVIREQEPSKPSTKLSTAEGLPTLAANRGTEPAKLTRLVRGELDWIVMKALEKDRNRRYDTANSFAADVQRYLADEPVLACPPSAGYRLRKFARRNKTAIGVAGMVLFFLVLLGSGAGWALRDREAREQQIAQETARKLALTEEGIRQALDRASTSRAELQAILKKPGGVQQLLNQPARWELFIKTAQAELAQARRLAVRAEGSFDAESTQAMDRLEQQLTSDQADYDLARRLEIIRLDAFHLRHAIAEYPKAFARFGVLSDDPADATVRLAASPIKEQLVAALDVWARAAFVLHDKGLAERLLSMARRTAPDPAWGDRVRQVTVWRDRKALEELGERAPTTGLSPHLVGNVGDFLRVLESPVAVTCLRRAQAEHPADFWLNFYLADALQSTSPTEATGFYRAALAVRPGTKEVYNNLGNTLRDQKKLHEAIAAYHKAIEIDPKFGYAYNNLGNALKDQGKLNDAIVAYRTAIEIDPKLASRHYNLGLTLADQNKLDDAIACYRKAIEIHSKFAVAHYDLGIALHKQGKLDEAIAAYRKAFELDPKHANARIGFGNALMKKAWELANHPDPKLRDPKRAVAASKEAVELAPQSDLAWQYLGWVHYRAGNWKASIESLEKSCKLQKGGTGDAAQWIVMSLAHGKLANEKELPELERAQHKAEARRWYDQAVKSLDGWSLGADSWAQAIRNFRAEAAELQGVKEKPK
jgi:serine/threonine protein kinase/tetratricopeptide (TPR) repeat protein